MTKTTPERAVIFDFDSTIVTVETLDELARICLRGRPDAAERTAAIAEITNLGMSGQIGFGESLARRFAQLSPTAGNVDELLTLVKKSLSPSLVKWRETVRRHADEIWIVSGGFNDVIVPVMADFGIQPAQVLANVFTWSADRSQVSGYDKNLPSAQDHGKVLAIRKAGITAVQSFMVGDGMTDWQVRGEGLADTFIAYTETVVREPVVAKADFVARNFDDVVQLVGWR